MKGFDGRRLIFIYVYLAANTAILGVGVTFALLFFCQRYGIDVSSHVWLLAVPPVVSLFLNVLLIELVQRLRRK